MKNKKTYYLFLVGSVTVIVCAVYWKSLFLPFIQDDWGILNNFRVTGTPALLKQFFNYEYKLFFRPFAEVYLWLVYRLFGPNPLPFHVVALAAHILNACLVALILNHITHDRLIGYLSAIVYAAAIAIHLDPLAWAVGIYDVGGAFFFFLSLWIFLRGKPVFSAIVYFFGCLFKESIIILPVLLLAYVFLENTTIKLKEKTLTISTILDGWKQTIPLLIAMTVVLAIRLSSKVSPFDLPDTHPYAIALLGAHVTNNLIAYSVWMLQSILPVLSVQAYTNQFYIIAAALLLFVFTLIAIVGFRLRVERSQNRQIIFLLVWLILGLLPVLFLPNHTYRYYATYSLPAFVGLILLLIISALLSLNVRRKVAEVLLIGIISFAVIASTIQGNRIYLEGINQWTLSDFTNLLIQRAAYVNIIRNGLEQDLPDPPKKSVIVIGNTDLWSINKDSGPQFWYNDGSLRVFDLRDIKFKDGKPYIDNPIINQVKVYTGSKTKKIHLDPSKLYIYQVLNGKLTRIDTQDLP